MSTQSVQDMPPPGGFPETIHYRRYLPARGPSGAALIIASCAIMGYGWYKVAGANAEQRELRREKAYARIMLTPMLQAEADRDLVRRLECVRQREEEIMKDTPGWSPMDLKAPVRGIGKNGVADDTQSEPVYYTQRYVKPTYLYLPKEHNAVISSQWWRGSNMLMRNPTYHKRVDFTKEHPIGGATPAATPADS